MSTDDAICSGFWQEEPEPHNPFATRQAICYGYDVYGDLVGKISWLEYLYLLLTGKTLTTLERQLFEATAVAIANPGPRDPMVRGAMNAAVGGSQQAAGLIAALAIGAGQQGGAHEIFHIISQHQSCQQTKDAWLAMIQQTQNNISDDWPDGWIDAWLPLEHIPGFDPHGTQCPTSVLQLLEWCCQTIIKSTAANRQHFKNNQPFTHATLWLNAHRSELETAVGYPLSLSGVVGALFYDLHLSPEQAEMLYLLLRLPGAAAHNLEQVQQGFHSFPYFSQGLEITNDPGVFTS